MNRPLLVGLFLIPLACGSSGGGSGGSTGSGGAILTGAGGSGGTTGSGGATGSGGSNASGGATGAGGTVSTGGTTGTGGGSGGATAAGGTNGSGGAAGATGSGGAAGKGSGGATGSGGAAGKGSGGATGSGGAAGTTGSGGAAGATGSGGTAGGSGAHVSVLQHHNDLARDGLYIDAAFPQNGLSNLAIDTSFANAKYTGNVYAQPLYLAGRGSTPDEVIVATESDKVYAFNASTGAAVWATPASVGTAVGSGVLPCGNIASGSNTLGVTGTPVIDGTARIIYLDAMTTDSTAGAKHMIHALNADTGAEESGWPVDVDAKASSGGTTFDSTVQNQRAALTLVGGKLFVPYSGHVGDCQGYHGWMVGVTTGSSPAVTSWATRAVAGGIWGSTGPASDGTSLFFATGNTKAMASSGATGSSPSTWGDGETVYKFPTTLVGPAMTTPGTTTDYFVPSNWASLDSSDSDMGGTNPILVNVPGATPSALVVALGKDKNAYLLNKANLGGMDATPLAKTTVSTGVIISAAAAYTTSKGTYVVFRGSGSNCPSGTGGLVALKIAAANPPTVSTAWCGGPSGSGSPAVTQTDGNGSDTIVWSVGNDNKLHGVDGDTGTSVFAGGSTAMSAVNTIQTPIVANGRIFVASNTQVYAWKP